jgi:hypothetical protein
MNANDIIAVIIARVHRPQLQSAHSRSVSQMADGSGQKSTKHIGSMVHLWNLGIGVEYGKEK